MLVKKIRPKVSVFRYDSSVKELCLVSELSFCWNPNSLKFEVDQNSHGEQKLTKISNLTHREDFSEISFDCEYRNEQTNFVLSSKNEYDRILYHFLVKGLGETFSFPENDLDKVELIFEAGKFETLRLTKSVNFEVVDALTISKKEGDFSLILFNPWRKLKLESVEMQEHTLVNKTEEGEIIYKTDLQSSIIEILKPLLKSVS